MRNAGRAACGYDHPAARSGATYNHDYWDFGTVDEKEYSYARDVAAHGFPTFAFDGIGSGGSSHPPSEQVSVQAAAYVAHQIVQGLRSGSITSIHFGKVIIVGHSLGSTAVWEEAISYADVDGVIITGQLTRSRLSSLQQTPSTRPSTIPSSPTAD